MSPKLWKPMCSPPNAVALGQTLQAVRAIRESDPDRLVAQNHKKQIEEFYELRREQIKRRGELRAELAGKALDDEAIEPIMQYARDVKGDAGLDAIRAEAGMRKQAWASAERRAAPSEAGKGRLK